MEKHIVIARPYYFNCQLPPFTYECAIFLCHIVHIVSYIFFCSLSKKDSVHGWSNVHELTVPNFHKPVYSITHESMHGSFVLAADYRMSFFLNWVKKMLSACSLPGENSEVVILEKLSEWNEARANSRPDWFSYLTRVHSFCISGAETRPCVLFTWSKAGLRANVLTSASF